LGAEANAVYSGTDRVPLAGQATMLELGGGLTAKLNANVSLFADADYEFAVGNSNGERRDSVRGTRLPRTALADDVIEAIGGG
jgi:hypothetical protein